MANSQRPSGIFARFQSLLNRVVSPHTRKDIYTNVSTFAKEQPFVASFLTLQLTLSLTPLLLFLSFSIGVLLLSLVSAVAFSLFWIGLAVLVLLPTLFVAVSVGVAVWVWAVVCFVVGRAVYVRLPGGAQGRGRGEGGLVNGKTVGEGFEKGV